VFAGVRRGLAPNAALPDEGGLSLVESKGRPMREIVVFSGSSHPALARDICDHLGVPLSPSVVERFTNDCLQVQLGANCRERDVFLIQTLSAPVQHHLMELLLMIDAARGASAARITAVMPFYAYGRSDKKDAPRISIGGRLVADLLATAGASRVLTMALHSAQVHGFFSVPVDHLHALFELARHFRGSDLSNTVVVSPDLGYAKSATAFARRLGVGVAIGAKQRFADDVVKISAIIGDVAGRDVIIVDDEIAGGATVIELLDRLREIGVGRVRIACTHGLFGRHALERLAAQPEVDEIVTMNTVPIPEDGAGAKLTVLSVAPALAAAMQRIHDGESVSELFQEG
jgi:ribose-phosphate pyrophosphokinase